MATLTPVKASMNGSLPSFTLPYGKTAMTMKTVFMQKTRTCYSIPFMVSCSAIRGPPVLLVATLTSLMFRQDVIITYSVARNFP